jgi:hypothetical protein
LGRALFALAHFRALKFIASHFCFTSIHCKWHSHHRPPSTISFAYEHF